jgi:E3 ubiquitin-protein ligase listerin
MSKRQFKSQASSGRLGGGFGGFGSSGFGSTQSSPLSYIQEPPDYSAINDANIVVAFKNLSKKDSTTKAKALEDIQAYVSKPDAEIEEGLLEAWVRLVTCTIAWTIYSDMCESGQIISSPVH